MPRQQERRFDWDDFKIFAAVARLGSQRRAADDLGITAPAVSRRMKRLEQQLGVTLFHRNPQGIALTPDGRRVLGFADAAEAALSRATRSSRDAAVTLEGECRISVSDGLGIYWLPRFLGVFAERHPKIALRIDTAPDRTIAKTPSHDIQIQFTDAPDPNLVAVRVATLHLILFGSTDYVRRHGKPATLQDLAHHRLVDLELAGSAKGTFTAMSGFGNRPALMLNSNGSHCEAIRFGAGVGVLPTYASLLYDTLVPLLPSAHYPFPVFLCYERAVAKSPVVRATLEFLRTTVFARNRMPWFADDFVAPDPQWPAILRNAIESGSEACAEAFAQAS